MTTAFRRAAGGVLEISGEDRVVFLQGQCTNDVSGMPAGSIVPAACLTPKGKLLFVFRVAKLVDRLRLLLPAGRAADAAAHLGKYAVFQKVSVADTSASFVRFDFWSDGDAPLAAAPAGVEVWPRDRDIAESWLVPLSSAGTVEAALAPMGVLDPGEAEVRRIEAGRALFGIDFDESNVPDEVGLASAVSTRKGCYVGQEVVARMRTYGKVARRLARLDFDGGLPAPGTRLILPEAPDRELGRVTSAARSARSGEIGLGIIRREAADGETLAAAEDPSITARISAIPQP